MRSIGSNMVDRYRSDYLSRVIYHFDSARYDRESINRNVIADSNMGKDNGHVTPNCVQKTSNISISHMAVIFTQTDI